MRHGVYADSLQSLHFVVIGNMLVMQIVLIILLQLKMLNVHILGIMFYNFDIL